MRLELVDNWRKLWKANSLQLMAAAIFAPEFLDFVASNLNIFPGATEHKETVRVVLIGLAMLLRFRKQSAVAP